MTYKWGKTSLDRLATCDKRLQQLCNRMLERSDFDMTITCGYRTKEDQEKAFEDGKSKAHFGQSKHNSFPQELDRLIVSIDTFNPDDYQKIIGKRINISY